MHSIGDESVKLKGPFNESWGALMPFIGVTVADPATALHMWDFFLTV